MQLRLKGKAKHVRIKGINILCQKERKYIWTMRKDKQFMVNETRQLIITGKAKQLMD